MKSLFIKYCLIPAILLSIGTSKLFADKKKVVFGSKDYYAIYRAKKDAKRNTNGCLWFSAGLFLNIGGPLIAATDEPIVEESSLIGKSPEYIARYIREYKSEKRNIETRYAVGGCIVSCIAYGIYSAMYSY